MTGNEAYQKWVKNPSAENFAEMIASFKAIEKNRLKLSYTHRDETLVFAFCGSMDTLCVAEIEAEVMQKVEHVKGVSIVFDMSQVTYVSSAFLRLCMMALKSVGSDKFCLENVIPCVKKVIKIAGLENMLRMTDAE
ncbi:MAG: hypothetical protein A2X49_14865 [Lentisphaerae bacterium GWF2_52_8]|nr:MAG: hypothetical protein A2X49_14865 [Lentisphaerae bacterium GWF2_52_8]